MRISNMVLRKICLLVLLLAISYLPFALPTSAAILKPMNNLGLIGYWPLDEGTGTVAGDVSGKNNKGVLTNGPTWVSGKFGKALNFDNANDYVSAGDIDAMDGLTQITASVWVKSNNTSAATNETHFIDKSTCTGNANGGVFEILSWPTSHKANFTVYPSGQGGVFSGESSANIDDMKWHHLVGTYNGSVLALYMDGALVNSSSPGSFTMQSSSHRFEIGSTCNGSSNGYIWDGQIDDARVYNRALSLNEIKQMYNFGSARLGSTADLNQGALKNGLLGYWTFDGKDMTPSVMDISGNGRHGTLAFFTSTTTVLGKIGQALSFNPSSANYVNIGTLDIPGPITLCTWAKWNNASDSELITNKDGVGNLQYNLEIVNDGTSSQGAVEIFWTNAGLNDLTTAAGIITQYNRWYHICAVRTNNTTGTAYVDGISYAMTNSVGSNPVPATGGTLTIGGAGAPLDDFHNGQMDDARIYNRALSATEIKQIYGLGGATFASSANLSNGSTLKSGLVGHWTFDGKDMVPNVRDVSGQGNHGNLSGFTSTTTRIGKIGQALSFGQNSSQYVSVAPQTFLEGLGAITVSTWIKPKTSRVVGGGEDVLLNYNNSVDQTITLYRNSDEGMTFSVRTSAFADVNSANNVVIDTDWHHVVGVYDGTQIYIYVDGVQSGTPVAQTGVTMDTFGDLKISSSDAATDKLELIDDVRVYNRALSSTEIKQLYNLGR